MALIDCDYHNSYTIMVGKSGAQVVKVDRNDYRAVLKTKKNEYVETMIDFFNRCNLFHGLPKDAKARVAEKSCIVNYPAQTLVLREKEIPLNVYIVKQGGLKLLRKIQKDAVIAQDRYNAIPDTEWDKIDDEIIMEVSTLTEGSYVCEYEFVWQTPMKNSVMTFLPTELIYISMFDIIDVLTVNDISILQTNIREYPNDTKIIEKYISSLRWDSFQKIIIEYVEFGTKFGTKIYPEELMRSDFFDPGYLEGGVTRYMKKDGRETARDDENANLVDITALQTSKFGGTTTKLESGADTKITWGRAGLKIQQSETDRRQYNK
jgi:CRP-like cAMP-binding protein